MKTVTLIPGEGAGRELAEAARRVIDASGAKVQWEVVEATDLERAVASIRKTRVALVGPAREQNPAFRKALRLFLTVIPLRWLEGTPTLPPYPDFDTVLLVGRAQEFAGEEQGICQQIAHAGFTYATMHARGRITMDLPPRDAVLRDAMRDVAGDYPQIQLEEYSKEVSTPFDMILAGGAGLSIYEWVRVVPQISVGENVTLFEAADFLSRPSVAAVILSGSLLLEHLNEVQTSERIRRTVETIIAEGKTRTPDLGGTASTAELTDAILAALPRR